MATTVNGDDIDFVKKLGADEVINYKTQAFDTLLKDYDAVYDTVGGETAKKSFAVLKPGGILVSMLGAPDETLAKEKNITAVGQRTDTNTKHLARLSELVDSGKIKVSIETVYPLDAIKDAAADQETHPQGKIVLTMKKT
ncbi:zinc-binding dehydrogenase [Candidatus Gottesmanbacteria bacterium]|nr:zinc-binding dehydrogenase [Candidatus Gottesmanbacteria bacterium]